MWIFSKILTESWPCLQEQEEGYSEAPSLDYKQLEQWKFRNIHVGYSSSDKMTVHFILSRFGRTFEASVNETINAELISNGSKDMLINYLFPEDSHVRIFPWLVKAKALTGRIRDCGGNISGWFARLDRQRFMWKTAQCSLAEDWTEYLGTWPRWGMMQCGVCWRLPTLALTIKGSGSGSWPIFPTPTASACKGWSVNHNRAESNDRLDYKVEREAYQAQKVYREILPTPTMSDAHKNTRKSNQDNLHKHIPATGGRLNPTWVEWLMGWPLGWTELKPLETDKSLRLWRDHFYFSEN